MNIRITDIDGLKPVLTQWDVDRVLYVEGCDTKPMLHFWNDTLTRAIVVEPEADGSRWVCRVPNILLQHFMPIAVSVFIQEEDDEGKTVARFVLPVRPKAKPQDYTYEENIGYVNWVEKSEEAQDLLDDIEDLRDEIQTAVDTATSASEAAVAAAEDIDETVAAALQAAKDSGDFDGADGQDGQDGAPGPKGDPGEDGVSPRFSSTAITGGHRVAVQDAYGDCTFDVMDGEDGEDGAPGVGVPSGGSSGDVLRKASGTDYDTEWHSPEIFWAVYDSTTADDIEAARIADKAIMCAWGGKTYVMNYRQNATKFYFTAADRNSFYILSVSGSNWSNVSTKTVGTYSKPSGGIPASDLVSGISVPPSGSTGQVLKKASGSDYDTVWADESGGGGTGDYSDLTNKPSINSVTLSGNKSLSDLGVEPEALVVTVTDSVGGPSTDYGFTEIKAASDAGKRVVAVYENCIYSLYTVDVPSSTAVFTSVFQSLSHVIVIKNQYVHSVYTVYNYTKPSGGIPATDLAAAVQTSLGKADTALQPGDVSEPYFVTYSTSNGTTWSCDKTFAQIVAALSAEKDISVSVMVGANRVAQTCEIALQTDGGTHIEFWVRSSRITWNVAKHYSDETISVTNDSLTYADVDAVAANQGVSHAGEFLVVGSNGYVTTMSLSTWSARSY